LELLLEIGPENSAWRVCSKATSINLQRREININLKFTTLLSSLIMKAKALTEHQKSSDIATLTQQLDSLNKQADEAIVETRKLIEKRDKLNEQFKQLRQETRELKAERDTINKKVHALKSQRDETRTTIHEVIDEIRASREKIAELKKKTPKRSHSELKKELDDIEWAIQTTSLDKEEEKALIENVKQLETQLIGYKKIEQQLKKIADLEQGLKNLNETANKLHMELSALAQKSQETHQKMLAKIEEAQKIKAEADSLHFAYIQTREKTKPLNEERRKLTEQKRHLYESQRQLQESQRQLDDALRKTAEQALRVKLESKAREKLQRGEKLSWNEFQLLAEADESETQD
jgi:uncharacterized coiled-coil DUF342 family protein